MILITSLEDERLDIKKNPTYVANIVGVRNAIDDVMVLRDSLRALIARIEDVDTLTDKLFANFYPATLSRCRVVAEYLSKWLKEGKG